MCRPRTSSLLFGADPSGRRQPAVLVPLSAGRHLNAHLHRDGPSAQLQRPGPRGDDGRHAAALPGLAEGARPASGPPAQAALVLDENQDIAQGEVGLALAAGQQVVLPGSSPPRARGGRLRGLRSGP